MQMQNFITGSGTARIKLSVVYPRMTKRGKNRQKRDSFPDFRVKVVDSFPDDIGVGIFCLWQNLNNAL